MGDTYSAVEIRSTIRTFQEYLRDLTDAKFETFQTKLRLFVNFCERDDAVRILARELHTRSGDVRDWFSASAAAGVAQPLPETPVGKLSHQYKVLLELKQQRIDLRNLLSSLFSAGPIEASHKKFRETWLEALRASFQRVFAKIEQQLEGKERVDLEAAVMAALAPEAEPAKTAAKPGAATKPVAPAKPAATVAPEPKPAPPAAAKAGKPAKSSIPVDLDLDGLVKLLEKTLKGAKDLAAAVKTDVQTDLKILKLELTRRDPRPELVGLVAGTLQRAGGKISELGAAISARAKK